MVCDYETGYMIVNWICLFLYLKYKFAPLYLFLFVSITTYNTSAWRISGQFVQTSYTKVENFKRRKLEYYKSMGEPKNRAGGRGANFEISVRGGGETKGEGTQFVTRF